jgi:hypothetical protein
MGLVGLVLSGCGVSEFGEGGVVLSSVMRKGGYYAVHLENVCSRHVE